MNRDRVQVVELLSTASLRDDEVRFFENSEMLHDRLARYVVPLAEVAERLPVPCVEPVEEAATNGIGKRSEDTVHTHQAQ